MGCVVREHPKLLRMRALRYVDLYVEDETIAKIWYGMYVPRGEGHATNVYITKEFKRRGMV